LHTNPQFEVGVRRDPQKWPGFGRL